jgi:uncharacterized membrane protein (DUF485 family)
MALTTDAQGRHSALHEQDQDLFDTAEYANEGPDFAAIRNGAEFGVLRRRFRRFVFPMSALFMGWYMTFVLLAAYAHDFMSTPILGLINIGMVLGLAQFVTTLLIMWAYCRYAARRLDPALEAVRASSGETS